MGKTSEPNSTKKEAGHQPNTQAEVSPKPAKGGAPGGPGGKVGCHAASCKAKDVKFNFCEEHFHQFKFGLITKAGEPVLDYERKYEHYMKWKRAQKVA